MPKNKEHGLRKGLSARMPILVSCEWYNCQEQFDNMSNFNKHVTQHLEEQLLASDVTTGEGKEPDEFICAWRDCQQEMGRDFIDLIRHVYFHAFHAKLKSYGKTIIEVNELEECGLEASSRNMIPELPDRLQCGWKDCDVISDNPDYFYQHVTSHIYIYRDGNAIPGGASCLWEGCETKTKNKYKLREHLRSHTQEKVIACPTCGGLFSNTTKMFDHLQRQIQSTVQTYQCSHCNKRCPTERLLRDHMRHHVNHYKCPFCDMTCPNPSGLRAHIKYRHSEEKPYSCSLCEYRGKTLADLRRHSVIHTNETTVFRCHMDDCEFEGKTYFALSLHFKKEHQGLVSPKYQCHLCDHHFTRGTSLTKHLKKDHKFKWPSGHRRFRYKLNEDGIHRLQTIRYESIELTQQLLSDKIGAGDSHSASPGIVEEEDEDEESLQGVTPLRASTPEPGEDPANPTSFNEDNLKLLSDVAMKLPQGRFCKQMERRKRKFADMMSEDGTSTNNDVSDHSDAGDMSDAYSESQGGMSVRYSESDCGRSEYAPSEFGQSEYQASDYPASDYPPSESCYMGSDRYAESETDPGDSEMGSSRPTPSHISMDPSPRYTYDNPFSNNPMDLNEQPTDMPPMFGSGAQSVDITNPHPDMPLTLGACSPNIGVVNTHPDMPDILGHYTQSMATSNSQPDMPPMLGPCAENVSFAGLSGFAGSGAVGTGSPRKIHRLQPLPTNIEETTRLLAPSL